MTEVTIGGKEYPIECSVYVLVQFCERIGEDSVTAAMLRLAQMGGSDGIKAKGVKDWSAILYEMLLRGATKKGVDLDLTYEECFETIVDTDLITTVVELIAASMPDPKTIREGKQMAAV